MESLLIVYYHCKTPADSESILTSGVIVLVLPNFVALESLYQSFVSQFKSKAVSWYDDKGFSRFASCLLDCQISFKSCSFKVYSQLIQAVGLPVKVPLSFNFDS